MKYVTGSFKHLILSARIINELNVVLNYYFFDICKINLHFSFDLEMNKYSTTNLISLLIPHIDFINTVNVFVHNLIIHKLS